METLIANSKKILIFDSKTNLLTSDLISLTKNYSTHTSDYLKKIKENGERIFELTVTRVTEEGSLKEPKTYKGFLTEIKENEFIFTTNFDLNTGSQYEDLKDWVVRTDNVLGIIPLFKKKDTKNIIQYNRSKTSLKYFSFLRKLKKELRDVLSAKHYIEIFFRDHIIECELLEVNKSNLLIKQLRMYNPEIDNKTGKYKFVDLAPQTKNILFVERNDFVKKVVIHNHKLKINPHDED